ncbi:MAG TPA: hypothetical protein VFK33_16165 [Bacillales bacterium]|nr:hypothetical protein [Bacillales bacterium]
MKLFHYHHWTDRVEETENFYVQNGFEVAGRFAKNGTYHPPLVWKDFRAENPQFRIIEVRKGKINVTFGQGKKTMFDHIGYLVSEKEHEEICERARHLGWNLNIGERRTFLGTPFRLRIELQLREDAVNEADDSIQSIDIAVNKMAGTKDLQNLFGRPTPELRFASGKQLELKKVTIKGDQNQAITDPSGVSIVIY